MRYVNPELTFKALADKMNPAVVYYLIRAIEALVHIEIRDEAGLIALRRKEGVGFIFNFWHGDMLLPICYLSRSHSREKKNVAKEKKNVQQRPYCGLVSMSQNGEYFNRVLEHLGWDTVRGSNLKGGIKALLQVKKRLLSGQDVVITPDGPQGPRREAKLGSLYLAKISGAPIIPVGVGTSRGYRTGSWDRLLLPAPFSRTLLVFGAPLQVDADLDRSKIDRKRQELTIRIDQTMERAAAGVGHLRSRPATSRP